MDRVNFKKFPHLYLIRVIRIRVNIIYRRNEISYLLKNKTFFFNENALILQLIVSIAKSNFCLILSKVSIGV